MFHALPEFGPLVLASAAGKQLLVRTRLTARHVAMDVL